MKLLIRGSTTFTISLEALNQRTVGLLLITLVLGRLAGEGVHRNNWLSIAHSSPEWKQYNHESVIIKTSKNGLLTLNYIEKYVTEMFKNLFPFDDFFIKFHSQSYRGQQQVENLGLKLEQTSFLKLSPLEGRSS